jgi:hypothetical protein
VGIIADIHEDYNPGTALANEMDLWNNSAGGNIWSAYPSSADDSNDALCH